MAEGSWNREKSDINKEMLIKKLRQLKRSKAPGENGIDNETWRLMPAEIGEEFLRLLNKVWGGEGLPKEWRTGVIYPIHKRGDRSDVKNCREVTLLNTAYKIYAKYLK